MVDHRRLTMTLCVRLFLIHFLIQALALTLSAQNLVEQELRIPAPGAGKKGLEALMVRPNEPGPIRSR